LLCAEAIELLKRLFPYSKKCLKFGAFESDARETLENEMEK
jgi:hypothetical protein